jgi:hypothetical protein
VAQVEPRLIFGATFFVMCTFFKMTGQKLIVLAHGRAKVVRL